MKNIISYILFISTITVFSQHNIEAVFNLNKEYTIILERLKTDSRNKTVTSPEQTTIKLTFTKSNENIKCIWTYGETTVVGLTENTIIPNQQKELMNLYKGYTIECLLNPQGEFIQLLNYDVLKAQIDKGMLKVFEIQGKKIDEQQVKNFLKNTYQTEQTMILTYFPEVFLYFSLYGENLESNKEYTLSYESPNPWGGENIPVEQKLFIYEEKENSLVIKREEKTDPKITKEILIKTLSSQAEQYGKTIKFDEISDFNITVTTLFQYNTDKKIIEKLNYLKSTTINGITQVTKINITLKI